MNSCTIELRFICSIATFHKLKLNVSRHLRGNQCAVKVLKYVCLKYISILGCVLSSQPLHIRKHLESGKLWHLHLMLGSRVSLWSIGYPSMMLWTIYTYLYIQMQCVETNFRTKYVKTPLNVIIKIVCF